jgi:uncharacterized membrane protein YdbT with pleckstrin-like domain
MDLQPGERVIYEGHPSWRSTIGFYIVGLIAVAAAAVIGALASGTAIAVGAGLAALGIVLLLGWLKRITTRYLITSKRLQIRHGILSRSSEQTRVERIVDVTVRQSVLERMLGIGTVDFDNASGGQEQDLFRFVGISRPARVTQAINEVHDQAAAAQSGATRPDTAL